MADSSFVHPKEDFGIYYVNQPLFEAAASGKSGT